MSRRTLVRTGGASAVLGGLVLASVAVQNVAVAMGLFATTGSFPTPGELGALSIVPTIALFVIPSAILVGLLGLFALLGASSAAKWGAGLTTAAMLLLFVQPLTPQLFLQGDRSPGIDAMETLFLVSATLSFLKSAVLAAGLVLLYVAARRGHRLGPWRALLLAIGLAAILSSTTTPFALPAVGLPESSTLSEAFTFVMAALWIVLGVAVWSRGVMHPRRRTTTSARPR